MVSWTKAKKNIHDASGVEYPDAYMWEDIKGVYYPVTKEFVLKDLSGRGYRVTMTMKDVLYTKDRDLISWAERCDLGDDYRPYNEPEKYVRIK